MGSGPDLANRLELNLPKPMTSKLEKLLIKAEHELEVGDLSPSFDNAKEGISYLKKRTTKRSGQRLDSPKN